MAIGWDEMSKQSPEKIEQPPLLRLILWLGKPLGVAFAPLHHVQVIYRMGKYAGARGPGLIYVNRLTETLGPLVNIASQHKDYTFENILSRDMLPVTMHVAASVVYHPLEGPELASTLTRVPREAYVSIAGTYLRWSLLALANQYTAEELTQSVVRAQLEQAVLDKTNAELHYLGLKLRGKVRIIGVELPQRLVDRHEIIAQRRASILAGTEFHPAEYRRVLVSEVIEHLARSGENESFLNFNEMLEAYATENQAVLPPPPNIIDVSPAAFEDKSRAAPPAPPPPPRPPSEPKPRSDRPKSRL